MPRTSRAIAAGHCYHVISGNLTARAESWEWGSLHWRNTTNAPFALARSPEPLPTNWVTYVNAPQSAKEIEAIRTCVNRQSPFGSLDWSARKAAEFELEQSLAPLGRPKKQL